MKSRKLPVPSGAGSEMSTLMDTLLTTGRRLEELTAGQVDTVVHRDGRKGQQARAGHALCQYGRSTGASACIPPIRSSAFLCYYPSFFASFVFLIRSKQRWLATFWMADFAAALALGTGDLRIDHGPITLGLLHEPTVAHGALRIHNGLDQLAAARGQI
jgi:hypothetical protein